MCKYPGWKRRTCQLEGFYGEQYLSDSDTCATTAPPPQKLNLLDLNCKFSGKYLEQKKMKILSSDSKCKYLLMIVSIAAALAHCSPFIYITHMSSFITGGPSAALHTKFFDSAPKLKWLAMLKKTQLSKC